MASTDGPANESTPAGPTLYLDQNATSGHFCPFVFDEADGTDYRVVQLTAGQSFTTLQQALDTQLRDLQDPTEAAAVVLSPQATESAVLTAEVGDGTTLHGFRVNPEDLTGVSIAFSKLLRRWEQQTGSTEVCLRGVESLFPYHDTDLLYRFLNTILATLMGADADVHMHLNPAATDARAQNLFQSLFTRVERVDSSTEARETAESAESGDRDPDSGAKAADPSLAADLSAEPVTMSDAEIDAVLDNSSLGILAFDGESPYAIPMSFGYDTDRRDCYLQLGVFEGSEKLERLQESPTVSLVVMQYERPDRWRSVILTGELSKLSAAEVDSRDVISVFANAKLASVDVFSMDPADVEFAWYRLDPSTMSGRKSNDSF
ncbi:pyridoxamine 5'-phosphate oxidase family protein [Halodesulfurarchaeum formicicum]|uniref:pyridoxamine 5'-phosphate oxidase family protein n=1 Tax=Halodesulfurarchaeum formicicum TaxID=1873524 RepID=UPI0008790250|nr:pyridoxamine 5'-phosphate oxidase family protein [Halodesulfurarchaeum formicicum]